MAMQVEILKGKSINRDIEKALLNLPAGLEETYNRALINWNTDSSEWGRAIGALNWLAFSSQPLTLGQRAEAMIIDPRGDPPFDKEERFHKPKDSLHLLSGLITVDGFGCEDWWEDPTKDLTNSIKPNPALSVLDESCQDEGKVSLKTSERSVADQTPRRDNRIVRFTHFSVKEYLISDRIEASLSAYLKTSIAERIKNGQPLDFQPIDCSAMASYFPLKEAKAHVLIAESCLIYHLFISDIEFKNFRGRDAMTLYQTLSFPLCEYAVMHGLGHAETVPKEWPQLLYRS